MVRLRHNVQLLGGEVRPKVGRGENQEHQSGFVQAGAERDQAGATKYNGLLKKNDSKINLKNISVVNSKR